MSMSKMAPELPAPLSLTLDEVREVSGGTTFANVIAKWWWYGQPAFSWAAQSSNVTVGQVGAGQVLAG